MYAQTIPDILLVTLCKLDDSLVQCKGQLILLFRHMSGISHIWSQSLALATDMSCPNLSGTNAQLKTESERIVQKLF